MSEYDTQRQQMMNQNPTDAIHNFVHDVNDYIGFVNRVSELLRISDGIGSEPLDKDLTVGDLMLSLVRRGEILHTRAEIMHDYANQLKKD
ncbi:MAG: hypothetical protein ACFE0Q_02085 [Anaerolineae bacterium]